MAQWVIETKSIGTRADRAVIAPTGRTPRITDNRRPALAVRAVHVGSDSPFTTSWAQPFHWLIHEAWPCRQRLNLSCVKHSHESIASRSSTKLIQHPPTI